MITSLTGMMWSVVYQKDIAHQLSRIHIIGPVLQPCSPTIRLVLLQKLPDMRTLEGQIIRLSASGSCCYNNKFYQIHTYASLSINNEHLKPSDITYADFNYILWQID